MFSHEHFGLTRQADFPPSLFPLRMIHKPNTDQISQAFSTRGSRVSVSTSISRRLELDGARHSTRICTSRLDACGRGARWFGPPSPHLSARDMCIIYPHTRRSRQSADSHTTHGADIRALSRVMLLRSRERRGLRDNKPSAKPTRFVGTELRGASRPSQCLRDDVKI